jgi:hypothetical protein
MNIGKRGAIRVIGVNSYGAKLVLYIIYFHPNKGI